MTCAICRFFDVCVAMNTDEACTQDTAHGNREEIFPTLIPIARN